MWFDSYLVTIMGLVIPWSFTLAIVDVYSLFVECPFRQPGIMMIVAVGDWVSVHASCMCKKSNSPSSFTWKRAFDFDPQVLSMLSLAAACATAGVVDLLLNIDGSYCDPKFCSRYQLSAVMAFLSWFLTATSSLVNLWFLASLWFSSNSVYIWSLILEYILLYTALK